MNLHIEFGENLSIFSQDIERKLINGVNPGPYLEYECAKKDM